MRRALCCLILSGFSPHLSLSLYLSLAITAQSQPLTVPPCVPPLAPPEQSHPVYISGSPPGGPPRQRPALPPRSPHPLACHSMGARGFSDARHRSSTLGPPSQHPEPAQAAGQLHRLCQLQGQMQQGEADLRAMCPSRGHLHLHGVAAHRPHVVQRLQGGPGTHLDRR